MKGKAEPLKAHDRYVSVVELRVDGGELVLYDDFEAGMTAIRSALAAGHWIKARTSTMDRERFDALEDVDEDEKSEK